MTPADLVLHGGAVYTQEPERPVTDAVAVRAGRIVAVGEADVRPLTGPATRVVDVRGGAVLPGFQDAHAHPVSGGLHRMTCDLSGLHALGDYLDAVERYVRAHPGDGWVTGAGWYGDVFEGGFPHRSLLDRVVGDRPALITSHDGHGAWASTAALRLAGITAGSADPPDGRILRDDDGEPTGMLIEGAADRVFALVPPPSAADLRAAVLEAQRYLHSLGVTAWQDAAVGEALGLPDTAPVYRELAAEGALTARVVGALWWRRDASVEQVPDLVARRTAASGTAAFRATAVKIMQDGVCENLTAAVLEPYQGHPDQYGMSFLAPDELARAVAACDAAGFDVHVHTVGDRAVRDALDAFATVRASGGADRRHQVAHLDLVHPDDAGRMRELGVIANIQPLWARNDPVLVATKLPYLTGAQRDRHFPFGSLARSGVRLAMGSDWPVSSPDPLWGIHTAVNRTAPPADPHAADARSQRDPLLPGEALSVETAIAAYTSGAARANHLDHETGTITPGKAADLVVLDQDPYTVPPREIAGIRAGMTIAGGCVVHAPEAT